jgi:hypothetical protein
MFSFKFDLFFIYFSNYKFVLLVFPTVALMSKVLLYSSIFNSTFPRNAIVVIRVYRFNSVFS